MDTSHLLVFPVSNLHFQLAICPKAVHLIDMIVNMAILPSNGGTGNSFLGASARR